MANYTPVAQNESSTVDSLMADETFATDRDKSDAKLHHLDKDRLSKHHLVSPQVSIIKHPSIMRQPSGVGATTTVQSTTNIPFVPGQQQGSVGQQGANNNVTGGGGGKPNVTFKLTDDSDKVLPVKDFEKMFSKKMLFLRIFLLFCFLCPFYSHVGHGRCCNVTWPCVAYAKQQTA
jgi:hypothetical protein